MLLSNQKCSGNIYTQFLGQALENKDVFKEFESGL